MSLTTSFIISDESSSQLGGPTHFGWERSCLDLLARGSSWLVKDAFDFLPCISHPLSVGKKSDTYAI